MTSDNDNTHSMTSSQPYLIRAIFDWIVDNDLTPYLMVDGTKRGTVVPEDYLDEKGRIILNISPNATSGLLMTNEEITLNARFSGQSIGIVVPTFAVKAIYARENGQGMMFDESKEASGSDAVSSKKRVLEAVSSVHAAEKAGTGAAGQAVTDTEVQPDSGKTTEPADKQTTAKDKKPGSGKKGKKGGSHLKVIK